MSSSSIEEIIRRAIEEGEFDDLPGKGKPLQLDLNPYEDADWRAAYQILKSSGFTLPWIESLRQIETSLKQSRQKLRRVWNWSQADQDNKLDSRFIENEWTRAVSIFRGEIAAINKQIRTYNLEVPNDRFQMQLINSEHEIKQISRSTDT
jgi:DnaJ family protein C protein 28